MHNAAKKFDWDNIQISSITFYGLLAVLVHIRIG